MTLYVNLPKYIGIKYSAEKRSNLNASKNFARCFLYTLMFRDQLSKILINWFDVL